MNTESQQQEYHCRIKELKDQLLSALAAIERLLAALSAIQVYALDKGGDWRVHDTAQSALKHGESVDLSILHEHDAKVRKPLVDALKFFRSVILSGEAWTATCQMAYDDVLATVKENE